MKKLLVLLGFLITAVCHSQDFKAGKVIPDYGKTFEIKNPDYKTDTNSKLKVVFDVGRSFNPAETNKLIETAARFLNMHEKAGVDKKNMKVALVIHGSATNDVLLDEFYQEKNPTIEANPNIPLLRELAENGVDIILCGQSAAFHKITKDKAQKDVQFALSAMTALVQLQNDNYRLINF